MIKSLFFAFRTFSPIKPLYGPKWPIGPVLNSGFLSMKQLGVLLLPLGWDTNPSQGYPQPICWYPFVHLGEEKTLVMIYAKKKIPF